MKRYRKWLKINWIGIKIEWPSANGVSDLVSKLGTDSTLLDALLGLVQGAMLLG